MHELYIRFNGNLCNLFIVVYINIFIYIYKIDEVDNHKSYELLLRFLGYSRLAWTGIKVRVVKANDISLERG